jgi:hypothetical protein
VIAASGEPCPCGSLVPFGACHGRIAQPKLFIRGVRLPDGRVYKTVGQDEVEVRQEALKTAKWVMASWPRP